MSMFRGNVFSRVWPLLVMFLPAAAFGQQPLRVAPLPVEIGNTPAMATENVRGSGLSTSLTQMSPPNPVLPASPVNYQIRVSNNGNLAATGVSVVLTANGALTLQTVDAALTCNGSTFPVTCTLSGTVPVGTDTRILSFTALTPPANAISPPSQSFILGAIATTGGTADIGGSATTTVTVARDFSVSGSASPASVVVGQPFVYQIGVNNGGPFTGDWTGVQVTVDLPDQVRYRAEGNAGPFNCSGSATPGALVTCSYSGAANGGSSQSLTVGAEAANAGSNAIATLGVQAPADPNANNNGGSISVGIVPAITQATLAKTTLTPGPANPTLPVDFQLSAAANAGNNVTLSGLQLVDTLPTGLSFASVQSGAPAWSCSGSAQTVNCLLTQSLAPGASAPALVLRATPQPGVGGQTLTNQATLSSQQVAPVSAQSTITFGTTLDAVATLTASQNPVGSGATFSYLVGIGAQGTIPQGSSVLLSLPGNVTLSAIPGGTGWSCTGGGQNVTCTRTAPATSATPTAEVRVTAPVVGTPTVITASAAPTLPGNFDPNPAPTVLPVTVSAASLQVELLKSGPASVAAEAEFAYSLLVRNLGQFPASNLTLRDPLPAGVQFVSAQGGACSFQSGVVQCPLSLAAGATQTVTLTVRAPSVPGVITNTARVEFGEGGFVESTVQTSVTTALRADVSVSKTVDLAQVAPGGRLNYTVTVSNVGGANAAVVELVDTLPAGVSLRSITPSGCTGTTEIRCAIATLAAGAQQTYQIAVDVADTATGTLTNVARVSASNDDTPGNNEARVSTLVQQAAAPMADLALTAQVTPGSYAGIGAELVFRATLRNLGPNPAQAVQVTVQLPAVDLTVLSAQFGGQTCSLAAGGGNCQLGTLANGAQVDGEVRVRLTAAPPQVRTRFTVGAQTMDPVQSNNLAEAIANLAAPPQAADLALALNGPAQVSLGNQLSLSASITNNGPETASAVRLSGNLPAALRFVSAAGPASCAQSGQELRCDLTGSLPAREQRTVVLTLATQNAIGTVTTSLVVGGSPADPLPTNNTASYALTIGTPGDSDAIEQLLSDITDVFARDAVPTVADICARPPADLAAQCDAIIRARLNGDIAGATRGLRALFPEEVLSQALSANQLVATQFTNVDARINELRGGAGGFSVSGLTVQVGRQAIPLSIFQGFGQSEEEPAIGGSGDLISPWGGFVNGTISFGDQSISAQDRNTVADFDSYALTAGVDYRKSARLVFGGALGWNKFESNLTDEGRLDTKGWTLTGYGSWYPLERLYLDGRLSYGRLDFSMQRRILIPGVVDRLAQGDTDGSQIALALATGYHFNQGGWSITPNASVRYADTTYDAFTETGAGANNASFSENTGKSVQMAFGVSVSRAFSLSNGVLLPQFDVSLNREMRNQQLLIEAELLGSPGNIFRVRTDDADRTFGNVGLGFVFVMANGRQFYLSYRELLGLEGLSRGSINLGGRFEF